MRDGSKKGDKKTSTTPSDLHLGIYKSLTNTRKQEKEKNSLLYVVTVIVNIALQKLCDTEEVVQGTQCLAGEGWK